MINGELFHRCKTHLSPHASRKYKNAVGAANLSITLDSLRVFPVHTVKALNKPSFLRNSPLLHEMFFVSVPI